MPKIIEVLGIAGATAVAIAILAHDGLGLSPVLIRNVAVFCSGLLAGRLYFGGG
jgi:hypothetical protein